MSTPLDYADSIWNAGHVWQNGLAAVPVALIVAAICRWAPCRPATRHLLWLVVLLVFLVPQTWVGEKARDAATSAAAWTRDHATAAWTKTSEWVAANSECKTECEPWDTTCDGSVSEVASAETEQPSAGAATTIGSAPLFDSRAEPAIPRPEPRARPSALKAPSAHLLRTQPSAADAGPDRSAMTFRPAPAATCLSEPECDDAESPVCDVDTSASPCDQKIECDSVLEESTVDVALCPSDLPRVDAAQEEGDDTTAGVVTTLLTGDKTDHPLVSKSEFVVPAGADPSDTPDPQEAAASAERLWGPRIIAVRDAIVALPPIPSAIWAGGVAALVVAAMVRTLVQGRMLRRATAAPAEVRRMVASAAATLGLAHAPETWMVPDRISPMVWCGLKRRLLLPKELWAELDEVSRSAVIMHELAHLRRKDHWTCWAELIACAVYWWHPVVWWVRRRLREEADLCCDAWVTALFPMERRVYAQALLETRKYISRSRWSEPAVGLSATAGGAKRFARRLTMVMTQRNKPGGSWTGVALAAILAGAGLATGPIWACPPEEEKHAQKDATPAPVAPVAPAPVALTAAVALTPQPADVATPAEAPEQPDSTFERHMATRERGAARSRDLEALLEAAGERLDALDDRLDGLRDLLENAGEADESDSESDEAACEAGKAECEAMAAECEAACKAASEAQAEDGDDDEDDDECTPSRDKAASHGRGHSMNGGFDATANGRALVLIVGGDGQVQVYRVPEDRTESLISMLDAAGGPVVVQQGGLVAVNGADVNALVAGEVRERVARSRQAQQEIRAAQRARINTTTEAYRRQVEAYQRSAEDMQRKAEEMERQAEEMDSKAQSMNDEASSLPRSERRRVEADAQRFSRQTEQMRQAAESMNQQAEQLMQQAEQLASQAEAMREQAEAEAEAAAEQAEAEAANDDAPDADLWDTADDVAPEEDVTEPAYHEDPSVGYAR